MVNNSVKGRFQLKKDTEAHWNLARNFIPLAGEPIVYTVDENHTAPRIKIGDGTTYVVDLPFLTANCQENQFIKSGTKEYWATQNNYVPPLNTIIVYTNADKIEKNGEEILIPKIKIGDGNAYCVDLPFVDDGILEKLNNHINNTDIHVTPQEKSFWNNKINTENYILEENLIFTRN